VSPTREELRRATQQRVVDAANRLFQERGFAATTIRDVAEASGVSIGSVMATGDKSDLLVRVFDALIEAEHAQRDAGDAPAGEPHCVGRVMALVRPFVSLFIGRRELAQAYASILVSGNHTSTLFSELAARLIDEIRAAITQHGCTGATDAAPRAGALYFAYIGNLFAWSARGAADPSELDAALRTTFAAICSCKE
jgi:AcrR family transcriptional regulator